VARSRLFPGENLTVNVRAVFAALIIVLMAGVWVYRLDRQGVANLRSCGEIEPGGRRSDLVQSLGAPNAREMNPAGTRLVLFFRSVLFAARPIRAVVNVRDDVVMEIDCGDGRLRTYDKY
jgi:hypothetical protein